MFSTLFELAGFAAIIVATFLLGGIVPALYTAGGLLLLMGYAFDDERAMVSLARALLPARRCVAAVRSWRVVRRGRRELAKAG